MLYQITATVTRPFGIWTGTTQIPTFYLDSHVQGIIDSNHARLIACEILDTAKQENTEFDIVVTPIHRSES